MEKIYICVGKHAVQRTLHIYTKTLLIILDSRGGRSAYEFRYALFRYEAKQGKWEAPANYWRYQTIS
jgi:hypothetical protein